MLNPYAQLASAPICLTTSQAVSTCPTNAYKSMGEFGISSCSELFKLQPCYS